MLGVQTSGQATTTVDIADLSVLFNTAAKGITAVLGITERGAWGVPVLVGTWPEYVENFGGLTEPTINPFPLLCRRALEAGGKLLVTPVGPYTDPTDASTAQATAATSAYTSAGLNISSKATSFGTWANNKLWYQVDPNANGYAGQFDVTVGLDGYPSLTTVLPNVPAALTATVLSGLNAQLSLLQFTTLTGTLAVRAKTYLTGGTGTWSDYVNQIDAADYIGDEVAGTGLHALDDKDEMVKIAIPGVALPLVDTALAAYVDMRKDVMAVMRTPVGLQAGAIVDYRERTGSFNTGVPIDSWRCFMTTGGLKVADPETSNPLNISEIGDVLGAMAKRDNKTAEWFAVGGQKRGRISNCLGVVYDLGKPARKTAADNVDNHGVNAIINHRSFGPVIWGNSTLHRGATLLKHANVAELCIYLTRALKPLVEQDTFDPNDVETWQAIYKRVKVLMDLVKDGRGVWKYEYDGDQFIDNINQATVNKPANIDAGAYVFNLWIAPKVGAKYFGIRVGVTNSGVDFSDLSDQL